MSRSKHIDIICIVAIAITILLTVLFMNGTKFGLNASESEVGYESRIFSTDTVHTVDIVMNDWDDFIANCENEEYSACTVVIDGESFKNVGLRAKGNTSLSNVSSMDSQRYSFKLEFDQYEDGKSYYGLDKLCLNNLIQDNTMMKDYLAYQMMNEFGVDAPLSSYVYITVNGEDWGLYLAVEAIEDSFLKRNYGSDIGNLYKPDTLNFGAGRGNGKDFDMEDFAENFSQDDARGELPDDVESKPSNEADSKPAAAGDKPSFDFGGFGGGMGSDDVKLKYTDDDPESYSNIFDSAKTTVTSADKERLIESLKNLTEYTNLEDVLDTDEVLRYFIVHTFLCNGDSYTGSMIHNYYLYEDDGELSMIPWDYNLAYGTFNGGDASSSVNESISNPISNGSVDDRPMIGWIFSSDEYTEAYYELYSEFIEEWSTSGKLEKMIQDTAEMIRPYVEKDPTKFCTVEEFEKGVETISAFVKLRAEAVENQLNGDNTPVETDGLNLSDMGSMAGSGGFGGGDKSFGPGGGNPFDAGNSEDSKEDGNSDGAFPFGDFAGEFPSGDFSGGFPGGDFNGDFPGGNSDENAKPSFPGGDSTKQFGNMQPGDMSNLPTGSVMGIASSTKNALLLGSSVLLLIIGIVIAYKKKY